MNKLNQEHCTPCEKGGRPISAEEALTLRQELTGPWAIIDGKKLRAEFAFTDFREAMLFINKVAPLAEHEGHHPDLHIFYNQVTVELWTHAVGGLSKNDFILAAKIERLA